MKGPFLQLAVCLGRQRQELLVAAQRIEDGVHAHFHHLFRAHRVVALVLIEVATQ